jgi:SnoaL-like domain
MKKFFISGALLSLSLTSLSGLPHRTFAQPTDPQSVVNTFYAASNSYDGDTAAALFAVDAVITLVPPPPPPEQGTYKGIDQIKPWLQYTAQEHTQIQLSTSQVSGNKVTTVGKITTGDWVHLGVAPCSLRTNSWCRTAKSRRLQAVSVPTPWPNSRQLSQAAELQECPRQVSKALSITSGHWQGLCLLWWEASR